MNGTTTTYIGEYFEWTGSTSTMKRYYFAGSTRVAMRTGSTLRFLLGDHLGSTAITTNSSGALGSETRYYPWGEKRYSNGSIPTNYQFTDQRVESYLGYYYYNSRWYDAGIGRFMQADTVVPGGVQGLDRYAYVGNNPIRYIDPSGHALCDEEGNCWLNGRPTTGIKFGQPPVSLYQNPDDQDNLVYLTSPGQRMWDLYRELYKISGNQFTLEDFLTLILQRELDSWWKDDEAYGYFKEAAVRWFYTNWGRLSMNAILNWLGAGMQSAGGKRDIYGNDAGVYDQVFNKGLNFTTILADQDKASIRARITARAILYPTPEWTVYDATAPYTWGSIGLINTNWQETFLFAKTECTEPSCVLFRLKTEFVLTLDQSEYWYGKH